ncbi:TetR/AcrR family transcriptional regulator [Rhodococcus fascians]|nr:TetR/AcrR family transcriptional regulator [Rhodococcus fascians]MBY4114641.1 TetR/AcrR family transcriptional regulator [Rhodococcus fascians]
MMSKPLRADAIRNRARIMQVARDVFAVEGPDAPIDQIAHGAGVGTGTVYRHFPTKEALLLAIVTEGIDRLIAQMRLLIESDPACALYRFVAGIIEEGAADQSLVAALARTGTDIDVELPDRHRDFRRALDDLVAQGQRSGTVRSDMDGGDLKAVIVGLQAMRQHRGAPLDAPLRIVCSGLAPRPGL